MAKELIAHLKPKVKYTSAISELDINMKKKIDTED